MALMRNATTPTPTQEPQKRRHSRILWKSDRIKLRDLLIKDVKTAIAETLTEEDYTISNQPVTGGIKTLYDHLSKRLSENDFYRGTSSYLLNRWAKKFELYNVVRYANNLVEIDTGRKTNQNLINLTGLAFSALMNASDYRSFKFRDSAYYLDYMGAFLAPDKELVVRGGTGENCGFECDKQSIIYVDELLDVANIRKPSLVKCLWRNLKTEVRISNRDSIFGFSGLVGAQLLLYYQAQQGNGIAAQIEYILTLPISPSSAISGLSLLAVAMLTFYPIGFLNGVQFGLKEYRTRLNKYLRPSP